MSDVIVPEVHEMNCAAWHDINGHEVNGEDCTCGLRWRIKLIAAEAEGKRLMAALEKADKFVADELECREASYLPEPLDETEDHYLTDAQETLAVIRAALATSGKEVRNG